MNFEKTGTNQSYLHGSAEDYLNNGENEQIVGKIMKSVSEGRLQEVDTLKHVLEGRISIFADYETRECPTYASYANVIEALLDSTKDSSDEEIEKLRTLAEGRVREIRTAVRSYIDRFVKYHHIVKSIHEGRLGPDQLGKADGDRRRTHDALIETLRTTGKTIAQLRETARELGSDIKLQAYPSRAGDVGSERIFDGTFLDDRDSVRNWAVAAWTIEQIRTAKEKAAK